MGTHLSLSLSLSLHTYIYIYIALYIALYINIYMCSYIYIYIYIYIYLSVYAYTEGVSPGLELHFVVGAHFLLVQLFVILEASPNRHVPSYYRRPTVCTRHVRESLRFSKIHLKSPKIRGLTQPGVAFRSGRAFPPRPSLRHTRSRSPRRTGTPVAHLPPLLRPPRHPAQEITH